MGCLSFLPETVYWFRAAVDQLDGSRTLGKNSVLSMLTICERTCEIFKRTGEMFLSRKLSHT